MTRRGSRPAPALAEDVGDDDAGLVQRDVREHDLARDVADRPDAASGAQPTVDRDRATGGLDARALEAEALDVRGAADGDEQAFGEEVKKAVS